MQYLLSDVDRRRFEMRARWSFVSEPLRDDHFRLFNKNANETLHVRVIGQQPNAAVWIVACDAVPPYFRHVLTLAEGIHATS